MRGKEAIQVAITLLDFTVDGIFDDSGIGKRSGGECLAEVDPLTLTSTPGMA